MHTSSAWFNVGLNGVLDFWPDIATSDQVDSPVLTEVSSDRVVMIVL